MPISKSKFPLGMLVATPGVLAAVPEQDQSNAIARHMQGDWGDVDDDDKKANDDALNSECRLLSVYTASNATRFYIITEWDRSVTTLLLPSEY